MSKVLGMHETSNEIQLNKFAIFCSANTNMPYIYKRMVFEAAMTSSLLYGSETWLTKHPKKVIAQYNRAVKCLLGVRKYTSPDLCLIESGIRPVLDIISRGRRRFLESKLTAPNEEEPFYIVFDLCRQANTPGYRFLTQALQYDYDVNPHDTIIRMVREKPFTASKYVTYRTEINPLLSVHPVYTSKDPVPDYKRQALTRLRLMSHNLRIETGRRNGTPVELRLCPCTDNAIQSESHVLLHCPLSRVCRDRYTRLDYSSMDSLMGCNDRVGDLCSYVYDVLKIYV